jgi:hypothetical protein
VNSVRNNGPQLIDPVAAGSVAPLATAARNFGDGDTGALF